MKKTLKIKHQSQILTETEVEVEFPIYSEHALDSCTIYTKRISETETIKITVPEYFEEGKVTIELNARDDMLNDRSHLDYILGRGIHSLSKEEFEGHYAAAILWLGRFAP